MKDNFSRQSGHYAKFRPGYPAELIHEVASLCPEHNLAWDCGTGNGQVAGLLSSYFQKVIATDISNEQLAHAVEAENITYKKEPAESSSLDNNSADLITAAQAVHWFDLEEFYREVSRVLKGKGVVALLGYSLLRTDTRIDEVIDRFYHDMVGPYWDHERRLIEGAYQTIPFPFKEVEIQDYEITYDWTVDELLGYLKSWSAVQHYKTQEGKDPVKLIADHFREQWPSSETVPIRMPVISRVGVVEGS